MNLLITLAFVAGLVPSILLMILYGFRTRWSGTHAGRALFSLILVIVVSYSSSVLILLRPEWFAGSGGKTFRLVIRVGIALALWYLLYVFYRAQRGGQLDLEHDVAELKRIQDSIDSAEAPNRPPEKS